MRGAHQAFFLDDDEKARRGYAFMYGNGDWEMIRACHEKSMREEMGEVLVEREREKGERGELVVAERILELLADGSMRPSALRKAVGIRSSTHFNRYYLSPLLEKGIIARTDPDYPQSPQQRYCLT